mmetsp:Transcript_6055/g.13866  ORF Transcript_6055/g.13866 Transcript_6055/m.13866 type:complete len:261 (-) Transcript_6055:67-849(-)
MTGSTPRLLTCRGGLCVLWKPARWTVSVNEGDEVAREFQDWSPGPGAQAMQDWLLQEFGSRCSIVSDPAACHGLVHRLDRDTSGLLLWATSYRAYFAGRAAFVARRVGKAYVCLCHGWVQPAPRCLDAPLLEVLREGRRASVAAHNGRRACTEVVGVAHAVGPDGDRFSLVGLRLHTGRLHQIRAHLSLERHPLVGDSLYGGAAPAWCSRLFLHARHLAIAVGAEHLTVGCELPEDLRRSLGALRTAGARPRTLLQVPAD